MTKKKRFIIGAIVGLVIGLLDYFLYNYSKMLALALFPLIGFFSYAYFEDIPLV